MKLCISTLACPKWSLQQMIDAAVANGIAGIDFRGIQQQIDTTLADDFATHLDQTISRLSAAGLSIPSFNSSVTLVTPAAQRWQQMLEEAHRTAELSRKTKTPFVRVFGGGIPKEISREEALMMGQRHLRQVVKICKPAGLIPLLETHDDWRAAQSVLEMIHEFSPDEVGVVWDIEHTVRVGETPGDTARALQRYIRHVHIKDGVYNGTHRTGKLLGEGTLPLTDFIRSLKAIGYSGWVCLETERRWLEECPDPEQSVPQFAQFMRQVDQIAQ